MDALAHLREIASALYSPAATTASAQEAEAALSALSERDDIVDLALALLEMPVGSLPAAEAPLVNFLVASLLHGAVQALGLSAVDSQTALLAQVLGRTQTVLVTWKRHDYVNTTASVSQEGCCAPPFVSSKLVQVVVDIGLLTWPHQASLPFHGWFVAGCWRLAMSPPEEDGEVGRALGLEFLARMLEEVGAADAVDSMVMSAAAFDDDYDNDQCWQTGSDNGKGMMGDSETRRKSSGWQQRRARQLDSSCLSVGSRGSGSSRQKVRQELVQILVIGEPRPRTQSSPFSPIAASFSPCPLDGASGGTSTGVVNNGLVLEAVSLLEKVVSEFEAAVEMMNKVQTERLQQLLLLQGQQQQSSSTSTPEVELSSIAQMLTQGGPRAAAAKAGIKFLELTTTLATTTATPVTAPPSATAAAAAAFQAPAPAVVQDSLAVAELESPIVQAVMSLFLRFAQLPLFLLDQSSSSPSSHLSSMVDVIHECAQLSLEAAAEVAGAVALAERKNRRRLAEGAVAAMSTATAAVSLAASVMRLVEGAGQKRARVAASLSDGSDNDVEEDNEEKAAEYDRCLVRLLRVVLSCHLSPSPSSLYPPSLANLPPELFPLGRCLELCAAFTLAPEPSAVTSTSTTLTHPFTSGLSSELPGEDTSRQTGSRSAAFMDESVGLWAVIGRAVAAHVSTSTSTSTLPSQWSEQGELLGRVAVALLERCCLFTASYADVDGGAAAATGDTGGDGYNAALVELAEDVGDEDNDDKDDEEGGDVEGGGNGHRNGGGASLFSEELEEEEDEGDDCENENAASTSTSPASALDAFLRRASAVVLKLAVHVPHASLALSPRLHSLLPAAMQALFSSPCPTIAVAKDASTLLHIASRLAVTSLANTTTSAPSPSSFLGDDGGGSSDIRHHRALSVVELVVTAAAAATSSSSSPASASSYPVSPALQAQQPQQQPLQPLQPVKPFQQRLFSRGKFAARAHTSLLTSLDLLLNCPTLDLIIFSSLQSSPSLQSPSSPPSSPSWSSPSSSTFALGVIDGIVSVVAGSLDCSSSPAPEHVMMASISLFHTLVRATINSLSCSSWSLLQHLMHSHPSFASSLLNTTSCSLPFSSSSSPSPSSCSSFSSSLQLPPRVHAALAAAALDVILGSRNSLNLSGGGCDGSVVDSNISTFLRPTRDEIFAAAVLASTLASTSSPSSFSPCSLPTKNQCLALELHGFIASAAAANTSATDAASSPLLSVLGVTIHSPPPPSLSSASPPPSDLIHAASTVLGWCLVSAASCSLITPTQRAHFRRIASTADRQDRRKAREAAAAVIAGTTAGLTAATAGGGTGFTSISNRSSSASGGGDGGGGDGSGSLVVSPEQAADARAMSGVGSVGDCLAAASAALKLITTVARQENQDRKRRRGVGGGGGSGGGDIESGSSSMAAATTMSTILSSLALPISSFTSPTTTTATVVGVLSSLDGGVKVLSSITDLFTTLVVGVTAGESSEIAAAFGTSFQQPHFSPSTLAPSPPPPSVPSESLVAMVRCSCTLALDALAPLAIAAMTTTSSSSTDGDTLQPQQQQQQQQQQASSSPHASPSSSSSSVAVDLLEPLLRLCEALLCNLFHVFVVENGASGGVSGGGGGVSGGVATSKRIFRDGGYASAVNRMVVEIALPCSQLFSTARDQKLTQSSSQSSPSSSSSSFFAPPPSVTENSLRFLLKVQRKHRLFSPSTSSLSSSPTPLNQDDELLLLLPSHPLLVFCLSALLFPEAAANTQKHHTRSVSSSLGVSRKKSGGGGVNPHDGALLALMESIASSSTAAPHQHPSMSLFYTDALPRALSEVLSSSSSFSSSYGGLLSRLDPTSTALHLISTCWPPFTQQPQQDQQQSRHTRQIFVCQAASFIDSVRKLL